MSMDKQVKSSLETNVCKDRDPGMTSADLQ